MLLQLNRFGSIPTIGTYGELILGDILYHTVEKEWLNNKGFISCVPDGLYQLSYHLSDKHGHTYILENHEKNVYKFDINHRYAILMHEANFPSQVEGCIGVGRELHYINGVLGTTHSKDCMQELYRHLGTQDHQLEIKWVNLNGQ